MNNQKTIFSKIIDREIPAAILYEDDRCVVIEDIEPAAAIHLLIIPKKPIRNLSATTVADQQLLGHLLMVASNMAKQQGCADNFKILINNGKNAGQTVFHLHLHLLSTAIKLK